MPRFLSTITGFFGLSFLKPKNPKGRKSDVRLKSIKPFRRLAYNLHYVSVGLRCAVERACGGKFGGEERSEPPVASVVTSTDYERMKLASPEIDKIMGSDASAKLDSVLERYKLNHLSASEYFHLRAKCIGLDLKESLELEGGYSFSL